MDERDVPAYVAAAARALGLVLDEAAAQRVAAQLARTAGMAAMLDAYPLDAHDEIAEIFLPAPFPASGDEGPR
jgi:hypothetical protein